ncbi:MAG: hypothetical protein J5644_00245 [Bacteroidales bacterium]|nr:hypothetical protein [Bacteroidales bacterium]
MMQRINLDPIVNGIRREIEESLDGLGLFYRIFARGKTLDSITHKIDRKPGHYNDKKKLQDIVGIRVVLYFSDDVDVVYSLLKAMPNYVDESNSEKDIQQLDNDVNLEIGKLADKLFMPQRLNLIFRMPENYTENLRMALDGLDISDKIDNTFELQVRTIFSEGWHEVEHDLRYKCSDDPMWSYCKEESRLLNGMYASLEATEISMRSMFDNIAYKNFKHNDWSAMMRNKFCIRFEDNEISNELINILNTEKQRIGKEFFKFRRPDLFVVLKSLPGRMPRKMDNFVFLLNRATVKNQYILDLEPAPISDLFDRVNFAEYHKNN